MFKFPRVDRLSVYCADVGSIRRGNFGWAHADVPAGQIERHRGGREIVELVDAVGEDLEAELPVALGFECPLFVPVPQAYELLGAARPGEGARSWSANAGVSVLATGLVQASWILAELRVRRPTDKAYIDWTSYAADRRGLFLWEAFVTGGAKAASHTDDAAIAVACFVNALPQPGHATAVTAERPVSLIGAAALWAGWSADIDLLHAPCLVMKAAGPATPLPAAPRAADPPLRPAAD